MSSELDDALHRLDDEERRLLQREEEYATLAKSRFFGLRSMWRAALTALDRSARIAPPASELSLLQTPTPRRDADPNVERLVTTWAQRMAASSQPELPLVTLIIPVLNHFDVTVRCLQSIVDSWFHTRGVQIVLVDDGSDDSPARLAERLPGLDFVRNGVNRGFVDACNRGAALSSARYLYFLNNDTLVRNGWLDVLVSTLENDPTIGAAGSKLVYPDGRLQEAGSIIFRDASGWNYGRGDDPLDSRYNFVRDVDYCSAASLLIRRDVFERAGGFDRAYAPAYYEDVDLCFAVRALGYRVVYQPRSVIVHDEGTTSGTQVESGAKRFQERNRPRFLEKWRNVLQTHQEGGPARVAAAARRIRRGRTILVIDSYVPLYDREAGSARLFAIVKILLALGYHVIFLPDNYACIEPYAGELQVMGIEVLHHRDGGRPLSDALDEVVPLLDLAWICRPELFEKYEPLIRRNREAKVFYDTIDLHFVRLRRSSELTGAHDADWKALQKRELAAAHRADLTITVTPEEQAVLAEHGIERVAVVPTINDLSTARCGPFESTSGVLFIGSYNHAPNRDAALWLIHEVMPHVWKSFPDVRVTLLGNNPDADVLALACANVIVPGYIADVQPFFTTNRVFAAPLRFGAGHKGKIGHSLAHGLPVVATPVAIEGYFLKENRDCLVAGDAEEFAAAIVSVYGDRELWNRLSDASIAAVAPFTSESVKVTVEHIMREAFER